MPGDCGMLEQMWAGPERKMCSGLRKQAWHPAALGGTRWDCRRDGLNPLLNPRSQKTTPLPGYLPGNGAEAAIVSTPTGHPTRPSIAWHPLASTAYGHCRRPQCPSVQCTCSDSQRVAEPFIEPSPILSLRRGFQASCGWRTAKTKPMIFLYLNRRILIT